MSRSTNAFLQPGGQLLVQKTWGIHSLFYTEFGPGGRSNFKFNQILCLIIEQARVDIFFNLYKFSEV